MKLKLTWCAKFIGATQQAAPLGRLSASSTRAKSVDLAVASAMLRPSTATPNAVTASFTTNSIGEFSFSGAKRGLRTAADANVAPGPRTLKRSSGPPFPTYGSLRKSSCEEFESGMKRTVLALKITRLDSLFGQPICSVGSSLAAYAAGSSFVVAAITDSCAPTAGSKV